MYFESSSSVPAAELAVHVLDYLYKKLDEVCLVQGGEVVTPVAVYFFGIKIFVFLLVYAFKRGTYFNFRRKLIKCYFIFLLGVCYHTLRLLIPGYLKEH